MPKIQLSFFVLLIATRCMAQEPKKLDLLTDLNYFKTTLPKRHINLFANINEKDFNAKVDAIGQRTNSLSIEEFTAELLKVIVAIGDEHTFIELNDAKVLPIKFESFKEGIYVTGLDTKYANLLMGKLTAINGIPIEEIVKRFQEIILHHNESYFKVAFLHYLNNPSYLKGLKITNNSEEAIYTISDLNGKETEARLHAVLKKDNNNMKLSESYFSMLATKNNDFYWYDLDKESNTLYFNYSKCKEMDGKSFKKFNDEMFAFISLNKPKKIILDLRNNGGGNSAILQPFIDEMQKSYLNDKKRFFVLIGRKTFSSALMNAVELKRNLSPTLVGEPTSGNINHYGEVRGFILPNTKLTIAYSTKYWETWKGKKGPLMPDIKISYSINQFRNGKDEALTYIRKKS